MQLEVGVLGLERGKFALGLLHPVLTEYTLARDQQLAHAFGAMGLGDRDQRHVCWRAARGARCLGDTASHLGQTISALTHNRPSRAQSGAREKRHLVGRIAGERRVERLTGALTLAKGGKADAVVGEKARVARQRPERVLV
jgi:hypothetical protein